MPGWSYTLIFCHGLWTPWISLGHPLYKTLAPPWFITTWWLLVSNVLQCYCLYLKVPLSTSWPLRRTWMPSLSREPKAMYSPRAQSTVLFLIMSPRPFRIRLRPVREGKMSIIVTECMKCVHIYVLFFRSSAPPWIVKSSTGTDDATCPMWDSSSSDRPVDGQLILLGWPSRVKKPAHQTQWLL